MATSKLLSNNPATIKTWSGQTVPSAAYKTMASFNIPAGTTALILGQTGNSTGEPRTNTCNFNHTGTAKTYADGSSTNNAGSGNFAIGFYYIEAQTDCTVNVRQYGYVGAIENALGRTVAIALNGGVLHKILKALQSLTFRTERGWA